MSSSSCKWTWVRGPLSRHSPNVDERRLPAAAAVAQEQLGALQAAVVEVGRLPAVGAVDAGEALWHRLPSRTVNDSEVGDWRLGPAGLGLRQVLLQWRGLVCQSRYHKVVGHPVTLVLNHGWFSALVGANSVSLVFISLSWQVGLGRNKIHIFICHARVSLH